MYNDLYTRVSRACCYITVFLGKEKIGEGTGFSHTPEGAVLTAAHVVTARWPIREEDYRDPKQKIYCKFPNLPLAEYGVFFCCIPVRIPNFKHDLQVDLALLLPKVPFSSSIPHIPALAVPPKLGQRVFMAGFSEEIRLPYDFDKLLPHDFNGVSAFRSAMERGYMADMTGPLFKSGFVGNICRFVAENTEAGEKLECDLMYVDNAMHTGGSGGPVFNERGEAVGVVSQRAVTKVDTGKEAMLNIPSGSTVAVSLAPMLHVARKSSGV